MNIEHLTKVLLLFTATLLFSDYSIAGDKVVTKPSYLYEHKSAAAAKIKVVFIPGSGRLSRDQLGASDFPGAGVVTFSITIQPGERFRTGLDLLRIKKDQYLAAVATVTTSPRLVGSFQVVRLSGSSNKREVISFGSHRLKIANVIFANGDYLVIREVTGY